MLWTGLVIGTHQTYWNEISYYYCHILYIQCTSTAYVQCFYSVCTVGWYIIALRILKYNIGYSYSYVEWHTKKYLFYENNSKIKIRLSKFLLKFSIFNIKVKFFLSKHRHMACLSRGLWLVSWQCEVRNLIGVTHLTKNPKTSQI